MGKSHLIGDVVTTFFYTAPCRVVLFAPNLSQNREVAWSSIHDTISRAKKTTDLPGEVNKTSIRIDDSYYIVAVTARDEGAVRGYHSGLFMPGDPDAEALSVEDIIEKERANTTKLLIVVDEAQNRQMEPVHKALDGLSAGDDVTVWKFGNCHPLGLDDDHGFVRSHREGSGYHRIHVSWHEEDRHDEMGCDAFFVPPGHMRNQEWLDLMERDHGKESSIYLSDVCGNFMEGSTADLCVTRSDRKSVV